MTRHEYVKSVLEPRFKSEDELYHHGILGMKWGIRRYQNEDGSLTPEGRERYRLNSKQIDKIQTIVSDARYNKDISDEVFNVANANKNKIIEARTVIKDGLKQQKEISDEVDDLYKGLRDPKVQTYYEAVSEIAESMDYYDRMNMEDLASSAWLGIFEDGQQGYIHAESLYAKDKGFADKIEQLSDKSIAIEENSKDAASAIINDALSEVGGNDLKATKNAWKNYTLDQAITEHMHSNLEDSDEFKSSDGREVGTNMFILRNAADGLSNWNKDYDARVRKAKDIVSNIDNSGNRNTWALLNQAIENLGYENIEADKMTASDWKAINNEISKLKM